MWIAPFQLSTLDWLAFRVVAAAKRFNLAIVDKRMLQRAS